MEQKNTSQSLAQRYETHLYKITHQQINQFIQKIQCKAIDQQKYDNLLKQWIQYSQERGKKIAEAQQIVESYQKHQKNVKINSTCLICFGQLTEKKDWCRVCGMYCCIKCIGRLRVFPEDQNNSQQQIDQIPVSCCQKCDEKYLQSLIILEDQRQIQIRRKAFNKLKDDNSSQNSDNSNRRQNSENHQQKLSKSAKLIYTLNNLNKSIKLETLQLKNKISWGEDVKRRLQIKFRKIRRTMSNRQLSITDGSQTYAPPFAYQSDSNLSNLNQSIAESVIQDQSHLVDKNKCCACRTM